MVVSNAGVPFIGELGRWRGGAPASGDTGAVQHWRRVNGGARLRAGDEVMRRLGAGVNRRRRRCAEVAGAVGVWLGTAVRADGRRRGSVRRGRVRARGHTGRPGRGACTRGSERAGCGVARLRSWRRGVHGSARRGAASVCTHACAGCGACARAWAVASCCYCVGGQGGRGALGAVAQGRARAEEKESRSGCAGKERGEGGEICTGSAVRGRPRAAPITCARSGACAGQG